MQQEEISNGLPVGSKQKTASCEAKDFTNSSVNEDGIVKKNESSGRKTKRKKKEHVEDNSSFDPLSMEEMKKRKRKNNQDKNLGHNALCLDTEGTLGEVKVEPKKKKKKSKYDSDDMTTISKKLGKSDPKANNEESGIIVNGNQENEDEMLTSETVLQTDKLNGVRASDLSAVDADVSGSTEKADSALSKAVEKKVLQKATSSNSEPFAQFQKSSTPPAFVRKCLSRTPRSEPQRRETNDLQVG